jgi:hypothetical protein
MTKKSLTFVVLLASFLLIPGLVLGHHGQAAYDLSSTVTVKGTVVDFHFVNPHCIVEFEAKDDKDLVQKWQGELTSPNHLVRAGWTATTLKAGDQLTLTGYRAKSGANSMWITKLLMADGQELKLGGGN